MKDKILITGGCGFIGHHFVEHLIKSTDWDILILDNLTYASEGFDRLRDIQVYTDQRVTILSADFTRPITKGVSQELGSLDYIGSMG